MGPDTVTDQLAWADVATIALLALLATVAVGAVGSWLLWLARGRSLQALVPGVAVVTMLAAVAGGEDAFRACPNFATLYCPISPGYFTPENVCCLLRWAEHGVPITLLSMAMGGASAPATLLGE